MTTPTDPTTLRTALEALVAKWDDEAPRIPDRRGSIVLTSAAHELRSLLETHRTTLATPAPAADEAHAHVWHYYDGNETEGTEYRCRCGAMTDDQPAPAADEARCVHDGCPFPFDRDWHHSVLRTMGRHPFQPAPTPAQTTPPATEPVAALVSELVGDLRLSELGRDGRLDIVARKLDAIVAAARAEVQDECDPCCAWCHSRRLAARARRAGEAADDR